MLRSTLRVFFAEQEEIVDNSSNRIRCSVNPLLTLSLWLIYFKHASGVGGGGVIKTGHVLERESLFNLVKMVVSALLKELECKVEKLNRGSCSSCSRGSKTNSTFQHVNKPSVQMKFYIRD